MRVEVYYNLHKKLFSVRALEGKDKGKVISHAHAIHLDKPKFVVQEGGRQRVIREKRKNVHAFVRGIIIENPEDCSCLGMFEVTYSPYKYNSFVRKEDESPVFAGDYAMLDGKKIWLSIQ